MTDKTFDPVTFDIIQNALEGRNLLLVLLGLVFDGIP